MNTREPPGGSLANPGEAHLRGCTGYGNVMAHSSEGPAIAGEYGVAPGGFRMPAGARPGVARLQVSDVDRSLEFWSDLLGFESEPTPDGVGLSHAGGERFLELRPGARRIPGRRGVLGLFHVAVLLPSRSALGRMLARLLRAGARPGSADHLVSEALYLQDPDDLGLELYADRPRGDWRVRGRELSMATEPLDFRAVLAAAEDADAASPAEAASAEVRIGHVHFHVPDLAAAESFYHRGLGLDKVVWSYPGALFLSAGGYHHHVGTNTWAGPGARRAAADEPRLVEWELRVPDAAARDAALASLRTTGAEVSGDVAVDAGGTAVRLTV